MITPNLKDGESYVEGRSEETARKLREAADKAGIDWAQVYTTSHGYVVPTELVEGTKDVDAKESGDDGKLSDFDPLEHKVDEVLAHLETASAAERERVLKAESESESPRKGIMKLADEEGDK